MDIAQLLQSVAADPEAFLPVVAGLAIVAGGLLIGILRGMSGGVLAALLFGGLFSMSPALLDTLERTDERDGLVAADVARGAAQLAVLNSEVVTDLSRVVATLRTTLAGLAPLVSPETGVGGRSIAPDPLLAQRFSQSLSDTEERLDVAIASLERVNTLRVRLESEMEALDTQTPRAETTPR